MMPAEGVSPGNVAVYNAGSKLKAVDRRLKAAELALRCAICGFGVLAAALIGSNTQVREFFSVEKKAKFTDMKALVFLVAVNGMAAGYSLIQGARCASSMVKGAVLLNKALALAIFSFDQAMAYLALAAVASAAQSAELGKFGQPELQWMKICSLYGRFCSRVGEGIASALLACLCMVTVSSMSAFNLFRLYGKSKGGKNSNTSW
ncbi:CASP-like protein 2B1 [Zingiber officinale]|uniref:CASP-like protein 2B1 n=1 Tax=Zingiber officinale TaxID=94328 RepID=UPI001C4AE1A1|nr:CASP-like protein 2B1 [Zingiber officinale]